MPKRIPERLYDLAATFKDADGNRYNASSSLVLWVKFHATPADHSGNSIPVAYAGGPSIDENTLIGRNHHPSVTTSESASQHVVVAASGDSRLSHSTAANGVGSTPGAPTDKPFSISTWIKIDAGWSGSRKLFYKDSPTSYKYEYYCYLTSPTNTIFFALGDETAGIGSYARMYEPLHDVGWMTDGAWHHLTFTYDGRGTSAHNGMHIYVDGKLSVTHHGTGAGTYTSMLPRHGQPLYIGSGQDGSDEFPGQIAEFAMWTKELQSEEIAAIYSTSIKTTSYSGILNIPPRLFIRESDHATGSYPSTMRTGDKDRQGKFLSPYQDQDTVVFDSPYAVADLRLTGVPRDGRTVTLHHPYKFPNWDYDLNYSFVSALGGDYRSPSSLVLWARMESTPDDDGPNSLTISKIGTPSVSTQTIGNRVYSTADMTAGSMGYTVTSPKMSFAVSGSAGTVIETPFSISCWVYPTETNVDYVFAKNTNHGGTPAREYQCRLNTSGIVDFFLYDRHVAWLKVTTPTSAISINQWQHLVCTYDASGSTSGMKIYINGSAQITTPSGAGTYVGMRPDASPLCIGCQATDGSYAFDGKLSEFAMWDTTLSLVDVSAIYGATRGDYEYSIYKGQTTVFEFNRYVYTSPGNVEVKIQGAKNPVTVAEALVTAINTSDIKIDAYSVGDLVHLVQNTAGHSGNGPITTTSTRVMINNESISMFGGGSSHEVSYPTSLPSNHRHISDVIASPNIPSSISSPGITRKGVCDTNVRFTPGELYTAFDESRVYLEDSDFYNTGSNPDIIPGFNHRLASKSIITLDINPTQPTSVVFSTGSAPNAVGYEGGVNSGISYFNWNLKNWEVIGNLTTGSNVDIINYQNDVRQNALLAFAPSGLNNTYNGADVVGEYVGLPVENFGFPYSSKFDATGSQFLNLGDYISHPFLLEKIVIEFSASFGPEVIQNVSWGPCVKQFFLINQFDNTDMSHEPDLQMTPRWDRGTTSDLTGLVVTQSMGKVKDLIAWGEISMIPDDIDSMGYQAGEYDSGEGVETNLGIQTVADYWLRDLNIQRTDATSAYYSSITGSYRLGFVPRVYPILPVMGCTPIAKPESSGGRQKFYNSIASKPGQCYAAYQEVVGTFHGGRQGTGRSSGRSFIMTVPGSRIIGPHDFLSVIPNEGGSEEPILKVAGENLRLPSPYLLTPDSKLVLGFANTPNLVTNGYQHGATGVGGRNQYLGEWNVAMADTVLSPGAGKITLYGSLVKNSLPVEPSLNQPLTSDSIHEALVGDGHILDQWDTDPLPALAGSYVDEQYDGSMTAFSDEVDNVDTGYDSTYDDEPLLRGVYGKASLGTMGLTGSLARNISIIDSSERFFDSMPGHPLSYHLADGFLLFPEDSTGATMMLSSHAQYQSSERSADDLKTHNFVWHNSFPFEGKYLDIGRLSKISHMAQPLASSSAGNVEIVNYLGLSFNSGSTGMHGGGDTIPRGLDMSPYANVSSDVWRNHNHTGTGDFGRHELIGKINSTYAGFKISGGRSWTKALMYFFGIGDNQVGHPLLNAYDQNTIWEGDPSGMVRGFKYGLRNMFPQNSKATFRRDHYGQFRDMLEQREFTRCHNGRHTLKSAVICRFFDEDGEVLIPEDTFSQNLSIFATSSLPYFDGIFRNRNDDPDDTFRVALRNTAAGQDDRGEHNRF